MTEGIRLGIEPDEAVVLKWVVPVDDQVHQMEWAEDAHVVHVAPHPDRVDQVLVWTIAGRNSDGWSRPTAVRNLQVFATGQPIPAPCVHLGTAVTAIGLVWHLVHVPYRRPSRGGQS